MLHKEENGIKEFEIHNDTMIKNEANGINWHSAVFLGLFHLVSLAGLPREVIATACRIRERAAVGEDVPVVIFCIDEIAEGDEVAIGKNVHVARPDNFNQLRSLLTRLLSQVPKAALSENNATFIDT